ncbi:MAG: sulfatase-like hydrolase/transferase [Planctomycetes bacterium]|nr:sulfatase-like hydrolase/transferase [Planctomycetota bacterium]
MRALLRSSLLSLLAIACACAGTPRTSTTRPNVIVVLADDLGCADLSCLGCTDIATPNLDRLAASGLLLTDAHVSASVCAPSRAGLMTGRYQQRCGAECNGSPPDGVNVPGTTVTMAEAMRDAGYQTFAVGKWHLGSAPECRPEAQGFDRFAGFLGGSRSYFAIDAPGVQQALWRDGARVPEAEIGYLTDWLTDAALQQVDQRDPTRPFLLYLAYNAPHTPMHASEADLARFPGLAGKRRTYAAMVHALDRGVGRVLDALDQQGIADDTLVVFLADNGGATDNGSDNGPWRGMKGSLWEGGHRVPFAVRWPGGGIGGGIVGGRRSATLCSSLDVMASALAAAGRGDQLAALQLDGVDMLPAWRGEAEAMSRDTVFWRRAVAAGVRRGDHKLWRVTEADGSFRYGLVNLRDDPKEQHDLAALQPERVRELAAALTDWERGLDAPRWLEGARWEANQRQKHDFAVVGREAERRLL